MLTFVTAVGQVRDEFPVNEYLHVVKHAVMRRLELDPHNEDEFVVTLNGNPPRINQGDK